MTEEKKRLSYADCKRMATEILSARGKPPYEPTLVPHGDNPNREDVLQKAATAEAVLISDFVQNWLDNDKDPIVIDGDKA